MFREQCIVRRRRDGPTPLIASRLVGRRADLHERSADFLGKEPGPRALVPATPPSVFLSAASLLRDSWSVPLAPPPEET